MESLKSRQLSYWITGTEKCLSCNCGAQNLVFKLIPSLQAATWTGLQSLPGSSSSIAKDNWNNRDWGRGNRPGQGLWCLCAQWEQRKCNWVPWYWLSSSGNFFHRLGPYVLGLREISRKIHRPKYFISFEMYFISFGILFHFFSILWVTAILAKCYHEGSNDFAVWQAHAFLKWSIEVILRHRA